MFCCFRGKLIHSSRRGNPPSRCIEEFCFFFCAFSIVFGYLGFSIFFFSLDFFVLHDIAKQPKDMLHQLIHVCCLLWILVYQCSTASQREWDADRKNIEQPADRNTITKCTNQSPFVLVNSFSSGLARHWPRFPV